MLIMLDEDILKNQNEKTISAIQNIADCIRNGRHIVIASRKLLQKLYCLKNLSDIDKRCFKTLSYKITQFGNIKSEFDTYIKISGSAQKISVISNNSGKIFIVPIAILSDSSNIQMTKLVCEDLTDCDFYKFIATFYIKQNHLPCKVDFDNINGGGENIALNYKNKLLACNSPCLSIMDSDKDSYSSNIGKTATNVQDIYKEYCHKKITDIHILNVREKENLIPPQIYYVAENNEQRKKHYEILAEIYNKNNELYLFGDIKSGLKINNNSVKNYIKNELSNITDKIIPENELLNQTEKIKKYFPAGNKLIEAIEEMHQRKDSIIILGVRKTFINLKTNFFDGSILNTILHKKTILEKHENEKLKNEIKNLEYKVAQIDELLENLPCELKGFWDFIGKLCTQWGCKINISFV